MSDLLLEQVLMEMRGFKNEVLSRMGGLEERMGGLEQRMQNLEIEAKGIREEHGLLLRQLEERAPVTNAVVTRLAEDVNQLRGEVAAMTKRLADHDVEIKVLKKAVAS